MPIYKENPDKLNLKLSNTQNEVKIKLDCENGTIAHVLVNSIKIKCGDNKFIGKAEILKGESFIFICDAINPDTEGKVFKIIHTIYEKNGNSISYTFPDEYTGKPTIDENDDKPDYEFTVNFV